MTGKKIAVIALAVAIVFVCALTVVFLIMPGLSYAMLGVGQPAYGSGYGRGMMGGYVNPGNASATPAPGYGPGMMGRGRMMGNSAPPSSSSQSSAKTVQMNSSTATQKVGNLNIAIALNPFPPVGFQKTNFDVTLTDENGQAITDATIALNLTMPSMGMPTNKPTAQHVGNGKYSATGMFTMRGWWHIEVIITRGSEKQSAFFDVGL